MKNIIKEQIENARKNEGITKKELCKRTGIKYSLLTQYLYNEDRRIPAIWLPLIADACHCTTDFLFGREQNESKN